MRIYCKVVTRYESGEEILACGHKTAPPLWALRRGWNPNAKRRRCYQCEWEWEQYEEQRVLIHDTY